MLFCKFRAINNETLGLFSVGVSVFLPNFVDAKIKYKVIYLVLMYVLFEKCSGVLTRVLAWSNRFTRSIGYHQ